MKLFIFINTVVFSLFNTYLAQAADISYEKFGKSYILNIDGSIKKGDYDKFIVKLSEVFTLATTEFISEFNKVKINKPDMYNDWTKTYGTPNGAIRITVSLNSLGGDVIEAIKIGRATRDMLLKTETGFITRNNEYKDKKCMSACFFIWASGIERRAIFREGENPLGIHRLYFNKDYYKGLSSKQAEVKYKKLKKNASKFIEEIGVPIIYVDKMFSVPSNGIYMISKDETYNLAGKEPYYEELLFSRCGTFTNQEESDYRECIIKKKSNKCSNMSSGYLTYVESKIHKTQDCWRVHDAIERWKRMNSYFKNNHRTPL